VTRSVLNTQDSNLLTVDSKIKTVNEFIKNEEFEANLSTFKRVANILKDIDVINDSRTVEISLFEDSKPEEKILFEEIEKLKNNNFENYSQQLEALFGIKTSLDNFFDNVIVNAENEKVKFNRQAILIQLYKQFLEISDIKEISVR